METPTNTTHLPGEILTEILARLPFKSISRFKSVCKTWKTTLESLYLRRLYLSLHQNSSSSWSLILNEFKGKELMGFFRCETWNLPKSPASYIPPPCHIYSGNFFANSSSTNGLVLMEGPAGSAFFVGNPILQQWVKIPYPPYDCREFGLVTRVDKDGVVLSFKVVRDGVISSSTCFVVRIYSSETGIWSSKQLQCPFHITLSSPMSLNEKLYLLASTDLLLPEPGVLIAHDFYSESDQCQVIPLPDHDNNQPFKRALTTSKGSVMYIKTLDDFFKVWRLKNDTTWQLLWEIKIPFIRSDIGFYVPMAMHPFNSDIVYVWSQQKHCLVSCNMRTQSYKIFKHASKWYKSDDQNCSLNGSVCDKYLDGIWGSTSIPTFGAAAVTLFQFVLPRWMESVPCPPQVEMINTTSLQTHIASMQKKKRRI